MISYHWLHIAFPVFMYVKPTAQDPYCDSQKYVISTDLSPLNLRGLCVSGKEIQHCLKANEQNPWVDVCRLKRLVKWLIHKHDRDDSKCFRCELTFREKPQSRNNASLLSAVCMKQLCCGFTDAWLMRTHSENMLSQLKAPMFWLILRWVRQQRCGISF